jgi:uncharacterized protein (DUF983 family)
MNITFLGGSFHLFCPECAGEGEWYFATESVTCSWCGHDWPTVEALKTAKIAQAEMKL